MASLDGKPKVINETYKGGNFKMETKTNEELQEDISDLDRRVEMLIRTITKYLPEEAKEDLKYI